MHRTHRWIRQSLLLLLCFFVAGGIYATPAEDPKIDAAAWEQAGNGLENSVQLTGTYEVALNDFCDTSSNAGTSASCETQLTVPAGTCPRGVASKGCRNIGRKCTTLLGSGFWCKSCYVKCRSSTCFDGIPIDGDEGGEGGDGSGCDDADVEPVEP